MDFFKFNNSEYEKHCSILGGGYGGWDWGGNGEAEEGGGPNIDYMYDTTMPNPQTAPLTDANPSGLTGLAEKAGGKGPPTGGGKFTGTDGGGPSLTGINYALGRSEEQDRGGIFGMEDSPGTGIPGGMPGGPETGPPGSVDAYTGGFWESFIESLISVLSLGMVDYEISGKDAWGGDWSKGGEDQEAGTVDLNLGSLAGLAFGPAGFTAALGLGNLTQTGQLAAGLLGGELSIGGKGGLDWNLTNYAGLLGDLDSKAEQVAAALSPGAAPPGSPTTDTGTTPGAVATTAPGENPEDFYDPGGGPDIGPASTTTDVAAAIATAEDTPAGWHFGDTAWASPGISTDNANTGWDTSRWAWTSQGGPVEAYQAGGLTGMMQRANMVDQRRGFMPTFQPQQSTQGYPQRPQWPQRPTFPRPRQDTLKPETYFHTHEGGKTDYPNFPKQFVNPPGTTNPFKSNEDRRPPWRPRSRPYPIVNPFSPQQEEIIPPISIAETEATAMAPEDIEQTAITSAVEETPTMPREINIRMPEDITANVDFPEEIIGTTQGYNRGGEIEKYSWGGILRGLAPMAAGYALGPMGAIPSMIGGGLTSYGIKKIRGKNADLLDFVKGGLSGYGGRGLQQAGMAASGLTPEQMAGEGTGPTFGKQLAAQTQTVSSPLGPVQPTQTSMWEQAQRGMQDWGSKMQESLGGLGDIATKGDLAAYQNILKKSALPIGAAMSAASITPSSERPDVPELTPLQVSRMTPKQRRAYIMAQRQKFAGGAGRTMTFAPPNVDIGGWRPNLPPSGYAPTSAARGGTVRPNQMVSSNEKGWSGFSGLPALLQEVIAMRQAQGLPIPFMKDQPTNVEDIEETRMTFAEAAEGGVMEIDEEMQSGSFVLPADVVSNVGDGSSDAGHRRLADIFEMEEVEGYARGGTGILKGPVKGVGSGLDDLIQTGIDGVRVARLSDGEFVVPKKIVNEIGDGSQRAGAEKLYDFMKDVRLKKHGTSKQPKEMHMSGLRKMV